MRNLLSFLVVVSCSLAACSDDNKATPDAAVTIDAPPTVTLDCATYCTNITADCTGANAQYGGTTAADATAHCMATCAKFPVGAAADTMGNTLGCRLYHTNNAKVTMMPGVHCVHAGPAGAQVAVAAPGTCGDACTNFCSLEIAACGLKDGTNANGQYASAAECATDCANFQKTTNYIVDTTAFPSTNPGGATLACRIYHTTNALISAGNATTHCPHTGPTPPAACVN